MTYSDDVKRQGFSILDRFVDPETVATLREKLAVASQSFSGSQRGGVAFGLRDLLNALPFTGSVANGASLRSIVEPILGDSARVVRAIYLDKHKNANWKVAWHQDLTIAVREKIELEGFGAWSIKAGIPHVQPPLSVLENVVTLRVHLDDADETNGALRVLPGTHRYGRLDSSQIQYWKQQERIVTCSVRSGGSHGNETSFASLVAGRGQSRSQARAAFRVFVD